MHFLTYVFVPEHTDVETAVVKALRPFGEELAVAPWKRHPGPREIAAMAKHYRVRPTSLRRLAGHVEDWCGGEGGVDSRGLFARLTCNPDAKWDWYEIGGRWRGRFQNDTTPCRVLLHRKDLAALPPHDFLTPDGKWHSVERYFPADWALGRFVRKSPSRWLAELTRALTRHRDHRIVCVDRHH